MVLLQIKLINLKILNTTKISSPHFKQTKISLPHYKQTKNYIPINVNTQAVDHYQQIGLLYDGHTTLPLLGRRIHSGSTKWNYYTLTNDNIALKIPLSKNGRGCMEQNGCDELYEEDSIIIPEYNNSKFKIKMYDRSPRYIPF
jgi:hypothetical protein